MHGAKGLEFRLVFVAGCEEGYLPHTRTTDPKITAVTPQDIEEERRLFYVAITRAKDRLLLMRAKFRVFRGKPMPRTPSRFLSDIPDELLEIVDVRVDPSMTVQAMNESAGALLAALDALGD